MENRPHGREKKVVSGTNEVRKGERVNTGGSPVGTGPRNGGSGSPTPSNGGPTRSIGGSKFIILLIVVVVGIFLVKSLFGGSNVSLDSFDATTSNNTGYSSNVSSSQVNYNVSDLARDKYTEILGDGKDEVTIMVYMCGTDLESKYGMASSDLKEMAAATLSDNVHIIVETGGCKKWQIGISNDVNQIYEVRDGKLSTLEKDFGKSYMTDPSNLTKFVKYCAEKYPANRNILIMWDHGGGSVSGYGYDEKQTPATSMGITKIKSALNDSGVKFDIVGFDACLMATYETADALTGVADYMIASEEVEPGTGWYYTTWLNNLSQNTSKKSCDIAKDIIDSYIGSNRGNQVTLSLVDLAEFEGVMPDEISGFATSVNELLNSDDYTTVSTARSEVRRFSAKNKINQVDLIDLATRIGTTEAKEFAAALKSAVKYNSTTITNANGISAYFPGDSTKNTGSAIKVYEDLDIDADYVECMRNFATLGTVAQTAEATSMFPSIFSGGSSSSSSLASILSMVAGGQTGSSASPLTSLLGGVTTSSGSSAAGASLDPSSIVSLLSGLTSSSTSLPSELSFFNSAYAGKAIELVSNNLIDPSRLAVTTKNGENVLALTEDEWALIATAELAVYVDDGEGYIDLGHDNTIEFNDDGDLILGFDGTWLSLDGHTVAYYMTSDTKQADGSYVTTGYIPALLNGELVNINVIFDKANPYGVLTGATPVYTDETDTEAKGDIALQEGDVIQPLCDYYDYDGGFDSAYTLGDEFTLSASPELANKKTTGSYSVCYRLTDIYGNVYFTPAIEFEY